MKNIMDIVCAPSRGMADVIRRLSEDLKDFPTRII